MSLYSNMQICGSTVIEIERRDGIVWVSISDGNQKITMEDHHVSALANALSAFDADEAIAAQMPAPYLAVDAAEPADTGVA